jgi:cell division protein FtsQ
MKRLSGSVCQDCCKAVALFSVIFVMTAAIIYVYSFAISSPYFRIKGTIIRGCHELTEKEVVALAAVKPSQTIFSVNLKAMARRISSHPWVKSVAVGREFPNRLVIEVQEMKALAMCSMGKDFYLMNKDGAFFKKLDADDDVDIPVLTGYSREDKMNAELLKKTVSLLNHLTLSKSFPTINNVSEINLSEANGLSLITDNGFCLKLGFDNYENKLQRLLPVVTALNKKNIKQEFFNIDLRETSKVYVERRDVHEPAERSEIKKGFRT